VHQGWSRGGKPLRISFPCLWSNEHRDVIDRRAGSDSPAFASVVSLWSSRTGQGNVEIYSLDLTSEVASSIFPPQHNGLPTLSVGWWPNFIPLPMTSAESASRRWEMRFWRISNFTFSRFTSVAGNGTLNCQKVYLLAVDVQGDWQSEQSQNVTLQMILVWLGSAPRCRTTWQRRLVDGRVDMYKPSSLHPSSGLAG
jgi:hypothetical protein